MLVKEALAREGVSGGFAGIYPVLKAMEEAGRLRRGYFVEGLGASQFAVPGAEDRLRNTADQEHAAGFGGDGPRQRLRSPAALALGLGGRALFACRRRPRDFA